MTTTRGTGPCRIDTRPADLLLVDDHPLLANALALQMAARGWSVEIADVADDPQQIIDAVAAREPRLTVLDLGLPIDGGGRGLIGPLITEGLTVVVLTGETDRLLWARCVADGAAAVLSKAEDLDRLLLALERLVSGETIRPHQRNELTDLLRRSESERTRSLTGFDGLTEREQQVLMGLLEGRSLRRMAECRQVSIETVRSQTKSVMRKLGVRSQLEAVARARTVGWTGA